MKQEAANMILLNILKEFRDIEQNEKNLGGWGTYEILFADRVAFAEELENYLNAPYATKPMDYINYIIWVHRNAPEIEKSLNLTFPLDLFVFFEEWVADNGPEHVNLEFLKLKG